MQDVDSDTPPPSKWNDLRNKLCKQLHPIYADAWLSRRERLYWYLEEVTEEGNCFLSVFYCGHKVAYAWSRHDLLDREGVLCDLHVSKQHRSQGLGRMLLQKTLRIATERKMSALTGSISPLDMAENTTERRDLLRWYRDAGFEILPPTEPKRIATVRMALRDRSG